jgi:hypothetical protein
MRRLIVFGLFISMGVISAPALASAQGHTPRTPWGDPDLQGTYTNKYEQRTPLERPTEFAGRRHEDITADEMRQIAQRRQLERDENAPFTGGVGDPDRIGAAAEFRDSFEMYKASRAWFLTDPPDGKIPPLTEEAKTRIAKQLAARGNRRADPDRPDSYLDMGLYERCITRGYPGSMMPVGYGNSFDIVQAPGVVAIRYEMVHETRVIPLDRRPHVSAAIRMDMGDARGWWEDDTLVVETRNQKQRSAYRNANVGMLRVIERFRRTSADRLEWTVTIDDPSTWTRPWTFSVPLTTNVREPVLEYGCHEGNLGLRNILSAARTQESHQR